MRFIDSPAAPGDFNMACDYFLPSSLKPDNGCILRLYTWSRPAISLGYHQDAAEVDLKACASEGIDVVRRPTGGRAILHAQELTYCFIAPVGDNSGRERLRMIYRSVHRAIFISLNDFGIEASFAPDRKNRQQHNPLCFATSAGTELEYEGKKIVGSAQRLLPGTILQHGSILLGAKHLELPNHLRLDDDKRRALKCALKEKSTHVSISDISRFRFTLGNSFARVFSTGIIKSALSDRETEEIESKRCNYSIY